MPEAYIERQIESQLENQFRELAERGIDPSKLKIDWAKLKEAQRPKALHDVKASLLVDKIAEREAIAPTNDEVDPRCSASPSSSASRWPQCARSCRRKAS